MSRHLYITFSGQPYDNTTAIIVRDGPKYGASDVWVYDDQWLIQHPFYQRNKWLFDHHHKRGCGWYAWKPLIILDAFDRSPIHDIVLYTDADTVPITNLGVLFDIAQSNEVMLFEASGRNNRQWCKRDCFIVMGQDQPKYHNCQAGVARFMLFRKGTYDIQQFLWEWLSYCVNPLATTFDPSILGPELPGFIEHRTEQAILTLLAHKYGYKLFREADQHGNSHSNDKDLYGQLFEQRPTTEYLNKTAPVLGSRFRNV